MGELRIIGLTGGIASGKSTVAKMLRALGARVIDADLLARDAVAVGSPGLKAIVEAFGDEMLLEDGSLDRAKLGRLVFENPEARARLNGIVHPEVGRLSAEAFEQGRADGLSIIFYEAPLLVENGIHHGLNGLIVVSVPPELQLARVMARDGLSEGEAQARIDAQLPLAEKLLVATQVIENTGDLEATRRQVERCYAALTQEAA